MKMLQIAAIVLGFTAVFGVVLFAVGQRFPSTDRVWLPAAAHGAVGIAGFAGLLFALTGPARGSTTGAANFGLLAAWFVGAGLVLAGYVFVARLARRQVPAVVIGLHATLAVAGVVMLGAYLNAG
jgi:hypothetical protein